MGFLIDHSIERGRVVIVKDAAVIAMATVETLAIVAYALAVGDETRTHPDTMANIRAWIRRDAKRRAAQ